MAKKYKKGKQANKLVHFWRYRQRFILPIIVAVGVSLAGSYYLLFAHADAGTTIVTLPASNNTGQTSQLATIPHLYDNLQINGSMLGSNYGVTTPWVLVYDIHIPAAITGYDCHIGASCNTGFGSPIVETLTDSSWTSPGGDGRQFTRTTIEICHDLRASDIGATNVPIITFHLANAHQIDSELTKISFAMDWYKGVCANKSYGCAAQGVQCGATMNYPTNYWFGQLLGSVGKGVGSDGNNDGGTPGNGDGKKGNGNGSDGTGTGKRGNGKGGGSSGGSTATKQGDKPATIPSSGAQSTSKDQPTVQPNAFYDGKYYAPGSDASANLVNVTVAGKKIAIQWSALIFLMIALAVGWLFTWRRRKLHTANSPKKRP